MPSPVFLQAQVCVCVCLSVYGCLRTFDCAQVLLQAQVYVRMRECACVVHATQFLHTLHGSAGKQALPLGLPAGRWRVQRIPMCQAHS